MKEETKLQQILEQKPVFQNKTEDAELHLGCGPIVGHIVGLLVTKPAGLLYCWPDGKRVLFICLVYPPTSCPTTLAQRSFAVPTASRPHAVI